MLQPSLPWCKYCLAYPFTCACFILTLNSQCSIVQVQGLLSTVNSAVDIKSVTNTVAIDH